MGLKGEARARPFPAGDWMEVPLRDVAVASLVGLVALVA